jgi:hypothetical protein
MKTFSILFELCECFDTVFRQRNIVTNFYLMNGLTPTTLMAYSGKFIREDI